MKTPRIAVGSVRTVMRESCVSHVFWQFWGRKSSGIRGDCGRMEEVGVVPRIRSSEVVYQRT